jgi:hypothetical protein
MKSFGVVMMSGISRGCGREQVYTVWKKISDFPRAEDSTTSYGLWVPQQFSNAIWI